MIEKTTEELKTMLRRDFRRCVFERFHAAVSVVEERGDNPIEKYKYSSGKIDAIANFALCAFNMNLFAEAENYE